jgi:predicted RNA-binding Zn-ribbon protein involved in translation (DUF1610 family)
MTDQYNKHNDSIITKEVNQDDLIELHFVCPECGRDQLEECEGGLICGTLVDGVFYESLQYEDEGPDCAEMDSVEPDASDLVDIGHVFYASGDDEGFNRRYSQETPGEPNRWFCCWNCGYLIVDDNGEAVETDSELAIWLLQHCDQKQP